MSNLHAGAIHHDKRCDWTAVASDQPATGMGVISILRSRMTGCESRENVCLVAVSDNGTEG